MSISELFDSEFKKRNKGYYAAIYRVAMSDKKISDEEKKFLDKVATSLDISESEFTEIAENPNSFPMDPPYLYIERLERLYDLARMVQMDHQLGNLQENLLVKFALALGFTPGNANYIVHKALILAEKKVDLDTFIYEMKNMNK